MVQILIAGIRHAAQVWREWFVSDLRKLNLQLGQSKQHFPPAAEPRFPRNGGSHDADADGVERRDRRSGVPVRHLRRPASRAGRSPGARSPRHRRRQRHRRREEGREEAVDGAEERGSFGGRTGRKEGKGLLADLWTSFRCPRPLQSRPCQWRLGRGRRDLLDHIPTTRGSVAARACDGLA